MDPISLLIATMIANTAIPAGAASAAPALAGAATAVATAPAWAVPAGIVGTGAAAGGSAALGAGAGVVANSPHAATGIENAFHEAMNNAKDTAAGSINNMNIPGVPYITFN
ncbi:hypothetical protein [Dietzia sp. CH92]|uniref:hypothetical protein n=1 Tax=Dietzia sp. CH92 TaxID=3051823 RepID=UPI0028D1EF5C|nr:hypothetical protein [Dietzia sp. CH92]